MCCRYVFLPIRFLGKRREKVQEKALFPFRKARREKLDIKELVKKSESDYIDFQEARSNCPSVLSHAAGFRVYFLHALVVFQSRRRSKMLVAAAKSWHTGGQ